MSEQTYEYSVSMTCEGCSKAVNRVLEKLPEVKDVKIDLPAKKVFVTTTLGEDKILESLKKTGKTCSYIGNATK